MKKTAFILLLSLFAFTANATIYYVTTTGNNDNDGLSEAKAWKTINYAASQNSPVTAGDIVYVKAGNYGAEDVFIEKNWNPDDARISFIGYKDTPGDINSLDFAYGDNVDPSVMPLIDGGNRAAGEGISLSDNYNITVKNFQVTNNAVGVSIWNDPEVTTNHILENIFVKSIGTEYSTAISVTRSGNNIIRNCLVVNATGAGMDVYGENNLVENCKVYSDENEQVPDGSYTSMDYYIVIKGNNNTVRNCYIERVGDIEDVGHGMEIKNGGENNLFVDCTAKNLRGGCYSVRWANVKYNEFRNCKAIGTLDDVAGFLIRDGASYNTFNSCISEGCTSAIQFLLSGEDANYCGEHNTFNNCIIKDAIWAFDLDDWDYSARVDNNTFSNCVFDNADYLFNCERENAGNKLVNCVVTNVDAYSVGTETVNFDYTYCDFYHNGFTKPAGTGNIEGNPLFVDAVSGDYHLQSNSPCIDAGTATDAPATDFEGTNRPQGTAYDVGAFEYSGPLAIELLHPFVAKLKDGKVFLQWSAAMETNNKGFEIEKSKDGNYWEKIGWLNGRGNSNNTNNYIFVDKKPFNGMNYYRFKQMDFDGKSSYSNIDSVFFQKVNISLFPNPFKNTVNLKIEAKRLKNQYSYTIFDSYGQNIASGMVSNNVINTVGIPNGIYFFAIIDVDGRVVYRGKLAK